MAGLKVEKNPSEEKLKKLGVFEWNIWEQKKSAFPWFYGRQVTCYFLEGEARITPDTEQGVPVEKGDLVVLPKGLSCAWEVFQPVRVHYRLGS